MEQTKKIKRLLEEIADTALTWLNDSGIKTSMLQKMACIQQELIEIDKIHTYNSTATEEASPEKEMVSHPSHYQGTKIECIDAMMDVFGKEKVSAFCELNAFKYLWRSNAKGTDVQDKQKAIWYLDKYNELNKE